MPISTFKVHCLSVMDRVRRTGRSVRITRYGRTVADVVPAAAPLHTPRTLGFLATRTSVMGDSVAPAVEPDAWTVLR